MIQSVRINKERFKNKARKQKSIYCVCVLFPIVCVGKEMDEQLFAKYTKHRKGKFGFVTGQTLRQFDRDLQWRKVDGFVCKGTLSGFLYGEEPTIVPQSLKKQRRWSEITFDKHIIHLAPGEFDHPWTRCRSVFRNKQHLTTTKNTLQSTQPLYKRVQSRKGTVWRLLKTRKSKPGSAPELKLDEVFTLVVSSETKCWKSFRFAYPYMHHCHCKTLSAMSRTHKKHYLQREFTQLHGNGYWTSKHQSSHYCC